MPIPLQITFRNMTPSPAVRTRIREHVEQLDHFHRRIMSCRVVIRCPHRRQHKGRLFHVSIDLKVPGHEIAINRDPPEKQTNRDIYVAVRDAFNALSRQLQDVSRQRRGDVKAHEVQPHGRVTRLFPDDRYGFIEASDGNEIYFHANSVPRNGFRGLKVGQKVRYSAEPGEKGLQASVVKQAGRQADIT